MTEDLQLKPSLIPDPIGLSEPVRVWKVYNGNDFEEINDFGYLVPQSGEAADSRKDLDSTHACPVMLFALRAQVKVHRKFLVAHEGHISHTMCKGPWETAGSSQGHSSIFLSFPGKHSNT